MRLLMLLMGHKKYTVTKNHNGYKVGQLVRDGKITGEVTAVLAVFPLFSRLFGWLKEYEVWYKVVRRR